jgi:hypothetical protein
MSDFKFHSDLAAWPATIETTGCRLFVHEQRRMAAFANGSGTAKSETKATEPAKIRHG